MSQPTTRPSRDGLETAPGGSATSAPVIKPVVPDYELLRLIGSGSYGEVWLARSITGAHRAVKVVYRRRFENARPFEREFNGIQKFEPISRSHTSQVDVLHVGRSDDYFYYVMELADDASAQRVAAPVKAREDSLSTLKSPASQPGATDHAFTGVATYAPRTLKGELHKRGRLPFEECLRVALSLTTALEHLHQHGLIHRDIKPSNIIFVGGIPKLADIGLVASRDATLSFVGTEGFVPPEGPGTPQADVFSLGKVLYEMCTGRDRKQFPELPTQLREAPDREALIELNEIVLRACEHDPQRRYQTAEEMHADLALLQAGKSVRRARGIEKQLRRLTRFGLGAGAVVVLSTAAWIYQKQQTRETRFWAEQSRQRLVRLHTSQGLQRIEEGDLLGALPWLVESLKLDQGSPKESVHRVRLGNLLRRTPDLAAFWHCPEPLSLIEVSSDLRSVLAAAGKTAQVWNLETNEPRTSSLQHDGVILSAAFNPGGDRVVTATASGQLVVWDISSAQPVVAINEPGVCFTACQFSPDNQRVAIAAQSPNSDQSSLWIWEIAAPKDQIRKLEAHGDIREVRFSPDGRRLAQVVSRFGLEVTVFDVGTGDSVVGPLPVAHFPFIRFSPDSRFLCVPQQDFAVKLLDLETGQFREIAHPSGIITSIAFNRNGKWMAVGTGPAHEVGFGAAYVYEVETGKAVSADITHKRPILSVGFSPDGRYLLTTSDDAVARVWELRTGEMAIAPLFHESPLRQALFVREGRGVLTIAKQTVRIWDLSRRDSIVQSLKDPGQVKASAWSADGQHIATATSSGLAHVWNTKTWKSMGPPMRHENLIQAIAFSPDGRILATGSDDRTARLWKVGSGQLIAPPLAHEAPVVQIQFYPKGDKLLTVSGNAIRFWETTSGQPLRSPIRLPNPIASVCLGPNPDRITVACVRIGQSSEILEFDWKTGRRSGESQEWPGKVLSLLPRPNGLWLALEQDDFTVRFWDSRTRLPVTPPLRHENHVSRIAVSPTLTKAATTSQGGLIRLWDLQSGEQISPPSRHGLSIAQVVEFSPDERRLLTASDAGTVNIWDGTPDRRSIETLDALALLLSAREIDQTGAPVPSSPGRLGAVWRQLQPNRVLLGNPTSRIQAWHRSVADELEEVQQWHERIEDWPMAHFHRSRVVELALDSAPDWLRRAIASAHVQDWPQAKADYERARALGAEPDFLTPDFLILQLVAGDLTGYRQSCAQLIDQFGTTQNAERANDIVWLCCLAPQALPDLERPVRLMRDAARALPARNNIINTLGAILFRAGQYQEAIETLHRATTLHPDGGTPFDFVLLAMAYQAWGQSSEAKTWLDRAVRTASTGILRARWKWQTEFDLLRKEAEPYSPVASR